MKLTYNQQKLEAIARAYNLKFVILHGSRAKGNEREDSDIDVAVLGYKKLSFDAISSLYGDLAEVFGDSIKQELDFKRLEETDPFFRYEVVKDGRLLYGDKTAYEEYKANTRRAFDDAKPLFDLERILANRYQRHLNKLVLKYA